MSIPWTHKHCWSSQGFCRTHRTEVYTVHSHSQTSEYIHRLFWGTVLRTYIQSWWYFFSAQRVECGLHARPFSLYPPPRLELRRPLHPLPSRTSENATCTLNLAPLPFSLLSLIYFKQQYSVKRWRDDASPLVPSPSYVFLGSYDPSAVRRLGELTSTIHHLWSFAACIVYTLSGS